MLPGMDSAKVVAELKRLKVGHEKIAKAIGRDRTAATKLVNGTRSIKAHELPALLALIREAGGEHIGNTPDLPSLDAVRAYVAVEVLPTYAGMGGGGTGEGEVETALVPRTLIEDILRMRPEDALIINCRGDSMEPVFLHGDQILVNRRETNIAQPGPFALWDGDGYVVKNVERIRAERKIRVFSENPKYTEAFYSEDDDTLRIMGRPVWFARSL